MPIDPKKRSAKRRQKRQRAAETKRLAAELPSDIGAIMGPDPTLEALAEKPRMSKKTANALGLPLPRELKWAPEKAAATRRGRPRLAETRGETLAIRLSADERARIGAAAGRANRKPSDWVRDVILSRLAAEETLAAVNAAGGLAELTSATETAEPGQGGGLGPSKAPKRVVAQCAELSPHGYGCQLMAGHEGPHLSGSGRRFGPHKWP